MKQLSVFVENKSGRLRMVTSILKEKEINILAMSLADTKEYGLLRMIVQKADIALDCLREAGFAAMLTEVIVVKVKNDPGELDTLLLCLDGISIEYMYSMAFHEITAIVLRVSDYTNGMEALKRSGCEIYSLT